MAMCSGRDRVGLQRRTNLKSQTGRGTIQGTNGHDVHDLMIWHIQLRKSRIKGLAIAVGFRPNNTWVGGLFPILTLA